MTMLVWVVTVALVAAVVADGDMCSSNDNDDVGNLLAVFTDPICSFWCRIRLCGAGECRPVTRRTDSAQKMRCVCDQCTSNNYDPSSQYNYYQNYDPSRGDMNPHYNSQQMYGSPNEYPPNYRGANQRGPAFYPDPNSPNNGQGMNGMQNFNPYERQDQDPSQFQGRNQNQGQYQPQYPNQNQDQYQPQYQNQERPERNSTSK